MAFETRRRGLSPGPLNIRPFRLARRTSESFSARLIADQPGKGGPSSSESGFVFKCQPEKRPGAEFDAIGDAARIRRIEPHAELRDFGAGLIVNSACHVDCG